MTDSELKRVVETALNGEVRLRGRNINVAVEDGAVVLHGQLPELAEKRMAVNIVRRMREVGDVKDQLRLISSTEMTDRQVQQHVEDGLQQERAIHDRQIQVAVANGVVTLTGTLDNVEEKCLAGLIAWWVPGVTDCDNQIVIDPAMDLADDALLDVIRQAFEKDVLVNPDTIGVAVQDGTVTLVGSVGSEEERTAAEHDAYYIWGVLHVINRLEITPR
ncbi:MAG: BON domain-containing protein [Candidatus Sericytochromatia bacterium]